MPKTTKAELQRRYLSYGAVLLGALIGLVASLVLSYEAIELAKHADQPLSCDISALVSCSVVAEHWSASLLGFPNAFIGMMALPVFITIAIAGLAGAQFPRWFMKAAHVGAFAALLFAAWMFIFSFFIIGVLCPWCLTLDVGVLILFFGMTRYAVLQDIWGIARTKFGKTVKGLVTSDYDLAALIASLVLLAGAVLIKLS